MLTNHLDDKKGPKYEVGQHIKFFDADDQRVVKGVVTEVGDETICVKWDDLREDTEYERSRIDMKGDFLYETD